jgi:hypothetical protein
MTIASQWFNLQKNLGYTITHIFVINQLRMTRCGWNRHFYFTNQLLARLIHAHYRVL